MRRASCSGFGTASLRGALALAPILYSLLWAGPAAAHHAMGGTTPTTFFEGLLSGLGHPVIGPDHLAFVIAIGIAAALVPAGLSLIALFVAASTAGVLIHAAALDLPLVEPLVSTSVIIAGLLIAAGPGANQPPWLALAAIAGLLHGYAFGEAVIGAERGVIGAYLIGLACIMSAIAAAAMLVSGRVLRRSDASAAGLRGGGVALAATGAVMLAATFA